MSQTYSPIYKKYSSLLTKLSKVLKESRDRVITSSDSLFVKNVNLFSRSYLINLCTYLESYLTEITIKLFERHCKCINQYSVPEVFILASLSSWSVDKKSRAVRNYNVSYAKKDIESFLDANKISGNIKKTLNVFELLGIELDNKLNSAIKDQISSIVNKRNDIVHRNNDVTETSLSDIVQHIKTVRLYMQEIEKIIQKSEYDFKKYY